MVKQVQSSCHARDINRIASTPDSKPASMTLTSSKASKGAEGAWHCGSSKIPPAVWVIKEFAVLLRHEPFHRKVRDFSTLGHLAVFLQAPLPRPQQRSPTNYCQHHPCATGSPNELTRCGTVKKQRSPNHIPAGPRPMSSLRIGHQARSLPGRLGGGDCRSGFRTPQKS